MKNLVIFILSISAYLSSFGQNAEFLKEFDFDSSYTIVCMAQRYQGHGDALPRFWFVLDNPDDMNGPLSCRIRRYARLMV